jgi:hypothetical protein
MLHPCSGCEGFIDTKTEKFIVVNGFSKPEDISFFHKRCFIVDSVDDLARALVENPREIKREGPERIIQIETAVLSSGDTILFCLYSTGRVSGAFVDRFKRFEKFEFTQ